MLSTNHAFAEDSTRLKKVKILPVPTIGYSPETKTYVGAVALFTLDFYQNDNTRTSNTKLEINYTWNNQLIVESQWNYFFNHELWFTRGLIRYSKYPDLYYGTGAETQSEDELKYESERIVLDIDALKKLNRRNFVGLGFRYYNYYNLSFFDAANTYDELVDKSTFGFKLIYLNDSRNNILTPTKGMFVEIMNTHNFTDLYYSQLNLDLRKYFQLPFNDQHIVAARFFTSLVFGEPTFYDYSLIGGDKYVRGYFYGRFRDQHLSTLQMEYRLPLFWRFSLAAFGGISMIHHEFADINGNSFKGNIGGGIRFLVDKKDNTNLRLDYAIGNNEQSGFYISFGESF